jgi:ABC-type multidrug transport system fused ATPase/permease subunit
MKNGRVNDIGTHAQLMSRQGPYAEMYAEQAKWYQDS